MPTRRKLILGSAALLTAAACGDGKAPAPAASAASHAPLALAFPDAGGFDLALIAQAKGLWGGGLAANVISANDVATQVRGLNSALVDFSGFETRPFLFWRSGGTRMQFVGWADRSRQRLYAVREDLADQSAAVEWFVAGLKAADAWVHTHQEEALALVQSHMKETAAQGGDLLGAIADTAFNRAALAPRSDGECQALKDMRPIDVAMRDANEAGHIAFLPEIIAPAAAAAWAK